MAVSTQSSRRTTGLFLLLVSLVAASTHAFVTPTGVTLSSSSSSTTTTTVYAATAAGDDNSNSGYTVRVVEGGEDDPTVVDVAAYRNNLVNPQMVVNRAQKKRDSIDNTKAALDGLKIGLLYVGPIIGVGTYFSSNGDNAVTEALTNYGE